MRGLSGVRSRVDRLALKLVPPQPVGCASCIGQDNTSRVICVYGDETPTIPQQTRCHVCGRVISMRYLTVRYDQNMRPDDMDR